MTNHLPQVTELPTARRAARYQPRSLAVAILLAALPGACAMDEEPAADEVEGMSAGIVYPGRYQVNVNRRAVAHVPRPADLVLDGHMRFYVRSPVEVGRQIHVHHVAE